MMDVTGAGVIILIQLCKQGIDRIPIHKFIRGIGSLSFRRAASAEKSPSLIEHRLNKLKELKRSCRTNPSEFKALLQREKIEDTVAARRKLQETDLGFWNK